jgi:hypothetical protein
MTPSINANKGKAIRRSDFGRFIANLHEMGKDFSNARSSSGGMLQDGGQTDKNQKKGRREPTLYFTRQTKKSFVSTSWVAFFQFL